MLIIKMQKKVGAKGLKCAYHNIKDTPIEQEII